MIWNTISQTSIAELYNSDTTLQRLFGVLKFNATLIGQIMSELYIIQILSSLNNKTAYHNLLIIILLSFNPLQLKMRLPNIEQDQNSYKTEYFEIVANKKQKKYVDTKIIYDWKVAQAFLVETAKLEQTQIEALIRFQKDCIEFQISSFYSYYFIQWLLSSPQVDFMKSLHQQLQLFKDKKSSFHKISNMIRMRQAILGQIAELLQKRSLQTYEKIDDLRFINLQLIKSIKKWKSAMKSDQFQEPIVFLYEGNNYLVKMISDNVNLINGLNEWKDNLIYPPNPFFVNEDGSYQGMTKKQYKEIQESMEILANEKAQQLKCVINPPKFVAKYAPKSQYKELSNLKNQLQQDKKLSVNSVYLSNSQAKTFQNHSKSRKKDIQYFQEKGRQTLGRKKQKSFSPNSLERMIKESQLTVLKQMKNLKAKSNTANFISQHSKRKSQSQNAYQNKIDSLRKKIELNIKKNDNNQLIRNRQGIVGQQSPVKASRMSDSKKRIDFTQIKQVKPKIKLITEKETIVEDVVKTLLPSKNLQMYQTNKLAKSQSLFKFKPMQKIQQVNQDKEKQRPVQKSDIKPITQAKHSRTMSLSFFKNKNSLSRMLENSALVEKRKQSIEKNSIAGLKIKNGSKNQNQKQDRSLIVSPNKDKGNKNLKTQHSPRQQDVAQQQRISRIDESLRLVKGRLRQISIKKIYQNKEKVPKTYRPQISRNIEGERQQSSLDNNSKKVDKELKSRVSNKSQTNFKTSASKIKKNQISKQKKQSQIVKQQMKKLYFVKKQEYIKQEMKKIDLLKKQAEIKQQEQAAERIKRLALTKGQLQKKGSLIQQLQSRLKEKEENIKNLLESTKKSSYNANDFVKEIQQKRNKQKQEFERYKLQIIAQNARIQELMRQEQQKQQKLKDHQTKVRQQQMKKMYDDQIERMKEIYNKKLAQAQQKRQEDERKAKQTELRLINENKKIEELKLQLQKRQMQQELMKQILQKQAVEQQQMDRIQHQNFQREKKMIEQQLKLQQEAQLSYLKQMEMENQLKKKRYQQMQLRSRRIDQQKLQLQDALKKLDQELQAKVKESQQMLANNRYSKAEQLRSENLWPQQKNQQPQQQEQDMQQLKLKLKKEILDQMNRRRKQQQQQEKQYQQQRRLKVQQIEQQIKQKLRKQDQQIERMNKKAQKGQTTFRKDLQWGQESFEKQREGQLNSQNLSKEQIEQNFERQIRNNEDQTRGNNQKIVSILSNEKKQQEQQQKEEQNNKNQAEQLEINQKLQKQQPQQEYRLKKDNQKQHFQNAKIDKQQDQIAHSVIQHKKQLNFQNLQISTRKQQRNQKPQKIQQSKKESMKQSIQQDKVHPKKDQQPKQVKKAFVKPTSEEVLVKYQNLQQYLKKSKQIFIQDTSISEFLSIFYGQLDHQVKQMMPYSQKQMEVIMNSRKVDIFDCHSIGWLQKQHYILIGNIDCVEAIGRKYGQLQIQVRYIFNKNNPYQKQYLAKKIKVFQHIGYVYQKKIKQQGKFSIKFIIKIPKQIASKQFKKPSDTVKIESVLSIQRNQHPQADSTYSDILINYLLSQTLKYNLSNQENVQYMNRSDFQSKQISKRMHDPPINNGQAQTAQLDDNRTELQITLKLNYIQFYDNPFYILKATQYMLNQTDKIFVGSVGQNLSAVIIENEQNDFGLDTFLNLKTKNLSGQSQINLAIPVWQSAKSYKLNKYSPRQYVYRQKVNANLIYGSIIDTSIKKDSYRVFQPPFVFAVFQNNSANHLMRPVFGTKVRKENLVTFKK